MIRPFPESSVQSVGNSSTVPLDAGETFTGTGEQSYLPDVMVSCFADAGGTLFFDFSIDGENWDSTFPVAGFAVTASVHEFHTAVKGPRFFRVRLVNGSTRQTALRLAVYYGAYGAPNAPIHQSLGTDNDALTMRLSSDLDLDLSRSFLGGKSVVHKFGANPDVAASTTEDVWFGGGTYNGWLTAAAAVRVASGGNAADDSDGGAGARTIRVEGLDENWDVATEDIELAGGDASSATTTTFIRVYRAFVLTTGTYTGANTGNITVETTGSVTMSVIEAGKGQSQQGNYTVPDGKTAYLTRVAVDVDAAKAMDVFMFFRTDGDDVTAPFSGKRLVLEFRQLQTDAERSLRSYIPFDARTDLWWEVTNGSGAAGQVVVDYDLILVDD